MRLASNRQRPRPARHTRERRTVIGHRSRTHPRCTRRNRQPPGIRNRCPRNPRLRIYKHHLPRRPGPRRQVRRRRQRGSLPPESVHRPGVHYPVIALRPRLARRIRQRASPRSQRRVCSCRIAILPPGPGHQSPPRNRHHPHPVPHARIRRLPINLLRPTPGAPHKHIKRPRPPQCVVALRPGLAPRVPFRAPSRSERGIHPRRIAPLVPRRHGHRIPVNRHRVAEIVSRPRIRRLQVRLLAPTPSAPHKHIGRSSVGSTIVTLCAVHPGRVAVLPGCSHHHRVPEDRHPIAENIPRLRIRRLQIRLLEPRPATAHEHIRRPRRRPGVIALVPVHPGGAAALRVRSHHDRIPRDRQRIPEQITAPGVRRLQISLLRPHAPAPHKNICRSGPRSALVVLVPVHPRRRTRLYRRPHHHRIPTQAHRRTKLIRRARIRCLQIRLLAPRRPRPDIHIGRPGPGTRITALRPGLTPRISLRASTRPRRGVHPHSITVLPGRPHHHRIPADGNRGPESITAPGVRRLQIRLLTPTPPAAHKNIHRTGIRR